MVKNKKLLIIDGHAVLHRAFHALPVLSNKKGELLNAVYGFLLVFFKAVKDLNPDFVAAAFDMPGPTFRHKKFKGYKATRPKAPDELIQQIPKIKKVLAAFSVPVFEKQGFEADDIIGTVRQNVKCQMSNVKSIILTGDLDILQLVDERTKVYAIKRGVKETMLYDKNSVKEKYGLEPSQLDDFRGLRGDPSDNIPGVPGIGEKTAIQLLKDFETLENLYQEIEEQGDKANKIKENVLEKLKQHKEQAFLSRDLAQIQQNVPLDFDLKKCGWGKYDKKEVQALLEKFEFYSLIKKLPGLEQKASNSQLNLKL